MFVPGILARADLELLCKEQMEQWDGTVLNATCAGVQQHHIQKCSVGIDQDVPQMVFLHKSAQYVQYFGIRHSQINLLLPK